MASIDPHDVETDPAIDVGAVLTRLRVAGIRVTEEHTGGGNWVAGIGEPGEYDENQGMRRFTVNVGPYYRGASDEPSWVGYAGDLYAVTFPADGEPVNVTATSADHLLSTILAATTDNH
jgi:hypothetical protein